MQNCHIKQRRSCRTATHDVESALQVGDILLVRVMLRLVLVDDVMVLLLALVVLFDLLLVLQAPPTHQFS